MPAQEHAAYSGAAVDALLTLLEEATRATPEGKQFVPPAGGELDQVQARFHHFIWGRRGSGKTSVLRYLQTSLRADGRVAVWIDEELFMALSYPDVLVSSVLELVRGVRDAVDSAEPTKWWTRVMMQLGLFHRDETQQALDRAIANLETLKQLPNDREIEWTRTVGTGNSVEALGSLRAGPIRGQVKAEDSQQANVSSVETVVAAKRSTSSAALMRRGGLYSRVSPDSAVDPTAAWAGSCF